MKVEENNLLKNQNQTINKTDIIKEDKKVISVASKILKKHKKAFKDLA